MEQPQLDKIACYEADAGGDARDHCSRMRLRTPRYEDWPPNEEGLEDLLDG